ncbi:hypothetical protein LAG90_09865 [Marinilongibacter aquaticus]|uniref:hypothetical protein n=1 Tax=Marinilongibacter aquaticus TaxID=2975157 RepID=UPI0021BDB7F9|nr:hypothetical protein [Marinilongibacter aquaticus]UBM60939.1 hypothetical protein LAG90_09865 [Marinilongibacter aquaticus]
MFEVFLSFVEKYPLSILESFCVLPVLILGAIRFKYFDSYLKIIWFTCLWIFILDAPIWYLALKTINNYFWANIQDLTSQALWIFSFWLVSVKMPRRIVGLFTAASLIAGFFLFQSNEYPALIIMANCIALVILCIIFFFHLIEGLQAKNILLFPPFWVVSGLMLMASGSILIFLFSELTISYKMVDKSVYFIFYHFTEILKFIYMSCIFIGFWVSKKRYDI